MTINIEPTFEKCAALILDKQGRLLVVRKKDSDIWISVGGKVEKGEDHMQCLVREIRKELCLNMAGEVSLYHESAVVPAANDPEATVKIFSYLVDADEISNIELHQEVEELHWLTKAEFEQGLLKLGSVLQDAVVPKLIEDGKLK